MTRLRLPGVASRKVCLCRTIDFARCLDGIDSIATDHWTIAFRGRISVVCKGIRKMTTS
jgi:hypothetical protein